MLDHVDSIQSKVDSKIKLNDADILLTENLGDRSPVTVSMLSE